ncbi:lysophospholipid acyltransferase family protein [Nocardioides bruguierae]|uniref:1-acyl-sn-glycerol-3-phosphate acyltransferase n=1 Tax=Nocardioides bruguierae TaxID=2945102 RepID=A0A9X2D7P8_9ACTN|nr:lysophospholipid acyltransferase family protein [Nocardioides bruguierae]MCL8024590.1 1-acyl-sn-glycerol-3-phosphate acyltransferase [Nocardioides bruguierae]MCM0620793.1 1-acyl-sn-glycerol-3-phosphate acyltransferase [Nocardioides bruguierae]
MTTRAGRTVRADACPVAGGRAGGGERVYDAVTRTGHRLLGSLAVQERWTGLEHVPTSGPVVIAGNHHAFPDFAVAGHALLQRGRYARFLCRGSFWGWAPLGRALDTMGHVPVDFAAPAAALLAARRLLDDGEAVVVFGQAGFGHSYTVERLMPGAAALARLTGAPLVPLTLWGTQRLWPVKRHPEDRPALPRPRRHAVVDVVLGEPLAPGADDAATTRALGAVLDGTLTRLQRLPSHRPRPGESDPTYPAHLGGGGLGPAEATLLDRRPPGVVDRGWGTR